MSISSHNAQIPLRQSHFQSPTLSSITSNNNTTSHALVTSLLTDCHALLSELSILQQAHHFHHHHEHEHDNIVITGRPHGVELRAFRSAVLSELASLERAGQTAARVTEQIARKRGQEQKEAGQNGRAEGEGTGDSNGSSASDPQDVMALEEAEGRILHTLHSSNLPFYVSVWQVAKLGRGGLVTFSKRFYWDEVESESGVETGKGSGAEDNNNNTLERETRRLNMKDDGKKDKKRSVLVDIVADNGMEWVKVSTISQKRLLLEMAKIGWEMDESDDEDFTRLENDDLDDEGTLELLRLARDMKRAAASARVKYKHPRVRFVLPKITAGDVPEVDSVLNKIQETGVLVNCGRYREAPYDLSTPFNEMLPHLLPCPYTGITTTLNVDCTILLALVSDLSFFTNVKKSGLHQAIIRQIEIEARRPLLPVDLWPGMRGKDLVCTEEAAARMRDIVNTIGTETEKQRTKLLLDTNEDNKDLIASFQNLAEHQVPSDWKIPVKTLDAHATINESWRTGRLPKLAHIVDKSLSDINRSVFLYGWSAGIMTISSNKTAVKQIESIIEEHRDGDESLEGPLVWLCDTPRSLIGKEGRA